MEIFFIIFLGVLTVTIITYPLFFGKIQKYLMSSTIKDFDQQDALLSALSELETDYQLGRLSQKDYEGLKLHFQRNYLQLKASKESA